MRGYAQAAKRWVIHAEKYAKTREPIQLRPKPSEEGDGEEGAPGQEGSEDREKARDADPGGLGPVGGGLKKSGRVVSPRPAGFREGSVQGLVRVTWWCGRQLCSGLRVFRVSPCPVGPLMGMIVFMMVVREPRGMEDVARVDAHGHFCNGAAALKEAERLRDH